MKKIKEKLKKNSKKIIIISAIALLILSVIIIFIINQPKGDKKKTCILKYNTNGGTQINSLDTKCGTKINEPVEPHKDGFNFLGWYIGDEKVNFDKLYLNENLTIEAKWQVKEDTEIVIIELDTAGGNNIENIEIAKGTRLIPPLTPQKEGYIFKYWSYNDKKFNFIENINENIKLVAVWEKESKDNPGNNINNDNNFINNNDNNDNSTSPSTKESCYYVINDLEKEFGGIVPEWTMGLDEQEQFSSSFGFGAYTPDNCNIIYKSDNSSVISVSENGLVTGKKLGNTHLNICIVDKYSQKELDCFKWKIKVQYRSGSTRAITDANNLVNALDGYYWYLDGYEDAYIKADNVDWYDHKCFYFASKYIELENNKFITTEDTGIVYLDSVNVHNEFTINPTEFAYMLIEDFNMHVKSNKLYITLGSKTYSFTKRTTEKIVKAKLNVDKTKLTVGKGSTVRFDVKISPSYAKYNLRVSSSDTFVVSGCRVYGTEINCQARNIGNATIIVSDSNGSSVNVDVNVEKVNVSGISLNKSTLNLERGKSEKLTATVKPATAEVTSVNWTSSNPNVAKVSSDGKVTAVGEGSAVITATTKDGGFTATCTINVTNPPLTANGNISYTLIVSSSGMFTGIKVNITATGGTGKYSYYYIKLYTSEGTLIGETTSTTSNEIFVSGYGYGSYYAEFEVHDSKGEIYKGKIPITTVSS